MAKANVTINNIPPETRVKLEIIHSALHRTYASILEEMVDKLWEKHKDEVSAVVSPRKIEDVAEAVLSIYARKGPRRKKSAPMRIHTDVRLVPVPKATEESQV